MYMTYQDYIKEKGYTLEVFPGVFDEQAAWLEKHGAPDFANTVFYPSASKTVPFGIASRVVQGEDGKGKMSNRLRIHNAVDRSNPGGNVYVPFEGNVKLEIRPWMRDNFGSLLIFRPKHTDFEIRIAHFDPNHFTNEFHEELKNAYCHAGTCIGPAGSWGLSTGPHTHTEVVSISDTSLMLDYIIDQLIDRTPYEKIEKVITNPWVMWKREDEEDPEQIETDFVNELNRKKIKELTNYRCRRYDYLDSMPVTFYNSWMVFNGL